MTCNLSGVAALGATTATVSSKTLFPGNPQCGSAIIPYGAWSAAVIPGSWTTVTLTIGRQDILRRCYGSITAAWDDATSTASFVSAALPASSGPPCVVTGEVVVPGVNIL
ncbi:hypothetical protein [Brevundimonas faecalis]|uniref:hypothetical protein n=1 Tax=Brevundimonas faecalis TaxID=947378 RepID=UPI0033920BD3